MSTPSHTLPRPLAVAFLLALVGIAFGFVLGGVFGLFEDAIKDRLGSSAEAAVDSAYGGDRAAAEAVAKKSWTYLKRAHLHGGGIGAAGVAAIAVLALFCRRDGLARFSALALGAGAVLYPLFWMLAGWRAPALGGTDAAKASLDWLAMPSAAMLLVGILGTIACVSRDALRGDR